MADSNHSSTKSNGNSRLKKEVSAWLSLSAVLIAVWVVISLLSGEMLTFWPAIPIGIWGLIILISRITSKPDTDS